MKIETIDVLSLDTIAEELLKVTSFKQVYRDTGIQWVTLRDMSQRKTANPSFKNVTILSDYLINREARELEELQLEAVMNKARELFAENRAKSKNKEMNNGMNQ